MHRNFILKTDSYKLTHHDMLPDGTTAVYSYLEARKGGEHDKTVWFGLQYYLQEYLSGVVVTRQDLEEARALHGWHFGGHNRFNDAGWMHIIDQCGGRLPLRINAVPEGSVVPCGNVLMTLENTDPHAPWLTNAVESLLMKVWYPTTVATLSWHVKQFLLASINRTGGNAASADYMLHDFGYRGASSEETAEVGGAAHLVNFKGSDTLGGIRHAIHYYGAPAGVASSVVASEHSVMTALGRTGEHSQAMHILAHHPGQIVSLVADSYDYYAFVDKMIGERSYVDANHIKLVIRPDSVTERHRTPAGLVIWTLERLAEKLGYETTPTGHKVVPYGVLWGDGLSAGQIEEIANAVERAGYAAHNMVYGMGGGLLQKVNRDTDRFALKCSAQFRDGQWLDVSKEPLDKSKASKGGRLRLVRGHAGLQTVRFDDPTWDTDVTRTVFQDGIVLSQDTFDTVRGRAALG